jgi:glycine/D-amino acid oxidase-like deaminating enzyme/nitrite reductase/ring-hydroxylating ferredoxin subunit
MRTAALPDVAPLTTRLSGDVCVIGAGIAGLSVALRLQRDGASVVLLDDGPIGGGETARTTAHLSTLLDTRYEAIERLHGEEGARAAAASHAAAISEIEAIVGREGIACDFRRLDGFLFRALDDEPAGLEREHAAALRAGVPNVWEARAPLAFETGRCLRFPDQAQMHPLRYLAGLAEAARRQGVRCHTAHATSVTGGRDARVETANGPSVMAKAIVVATNTPVNDRLVIHTKQSAYRSYVITAQLPADAVTPALYWDTADPFHYVRTQPDVGGRHQLLIVGGEDHHTGQADDADARFARLEAWAAERFQPFGPVVFRWSGQIMASIDGLGFIGRNPGDDDNVFIVTGDTGNGLTHGTIAGMLIGDLVAGRPNRWGTLYDPARITPHAALTFAQEGLHVAAGYARWLGLGERGPIEDLRPGCGAVFQRGLRKVAVYRDEHGALHECSAVCPHLGGVVVWNELERSWDCPCHGSRFDAFGRVINGPANSDLEPTAR